MHTLSTESSARAPAPRATESRGRSVGATRERILDAAEDLFAEHGFEGTSLRALTAQARVNLAAVHYHFGSKEALIRAVFERRLMPLNAARLGELEALEHEAGRQPLPPARIIEAFFGPVLRMSMDRQPSLLSATAGSEKGDGQRFIRLLGRAYTESRQVPRQLLEIQYAEVVERFKAALVHALPQIPEKELAWRLHFTLGAMSHAIAGSDAVQLIASYEVRETENPDSVMRRIVPFLVAGLTAPLPESAASINHGGERQADWPTAPGDTEGSPS